MVAHLGEFTKNIYLTWVNFKVFFLKQDEEGFSKGLSNLGRKNCMCRGSVVYDAVGGGGKKHS